MRFGRVGVITALPCLILPLLAKDSVEHNSHFEIPRGGFALRLIMTG